MLSRNEVKYIQSLCHKKQRQKEGLFIAEGPKITGELLQSSFVIKKIYALKKWIGNNPAVKHDIVEISETELERISALQTPGEVLVIAEQKAPPEQPVFNNQLTLVLDGIRDPGNLGTIVRIADWFGIQQVICSNDTVEVYNPKVIQSTMGSFIRVNVWYDELEKLLKDVSVPVFGALLYGDNVYHVQKPKEGLMVIGNESNGISENIMQYISHPITIPKKGGAESLNAAVATAIILSHLT